MARKSFILYADSLSVLDKLDDAQVGKLFRAIKEYQSGNKEKFTEIMDDKIIELVFEPFKIQFERDGEKYEERASRSRNNGKRGGRPSVNKDVECDGDKKPSGFLENPENPVGFLETQSETCTSVKPRKPDNVNDSVNDSDNDITLSDDNDSMTTDTPSSTLPSNRAQSKIDFNWIVLSWNTICVDLPSVKALSQERKAKIKIRVEEMGGWEKAMPQLDGLFRKIQQSKFLRGDNRTGWRCSFDWVFTNDKNWSKIAEGNYDNYDEPTPNPPPNQKTRADRRPDNLDGSQSQDWSSTF